MPKRPLDDVMLVIRGTVIDSPELTTLRVRTHAVLGVRAIGTVAFCEEGHTEPLYPGSSLVLRRAPARPLRLCRRPSHLSRQVLREGGEVVLSRGCVIRDLPARGFLCPGLVDTHTHAPQFSFTGIGYDLQLLDWLNKYTFPSEAKFKDAAFAARVCRNAVARTLRNGTTSCMYFATIHTDAALQLGRIASGMGQRAFVGKVNMDRNAPESYCETTADSLAETERFVEGMLSDAESGGRGAEVEPSSGVCSECAPLGPAPQPVITPRFVPTCSAELMEGLARIAARHQLLVTSHISENAGEIEWVKSLHPAKESYASCYDYPGLLGRRTVLAHGVYLGESERALLKSRGASVSHCPLSNMMLRSGMLNVRRLLEEGVTVSLGTDVSGGASPSMLQSIREALKVSNLVSLAEGRPGGGMWEPLSFTEAFHLATAAGARSLGVDGLTGDFSTGSTRSAAAADPADHPPLTALPGPGVGRLALRRGGGGPRGASVALRAI